MGFKARESAKAMSLAFVGFSACGCQKKITLTQKAVKVTHGSLHGIAATGLSVLCDSVQIYLTIYRVVLQYRNIHSL